jgi:hypothetical protein
VHADLPAAMPELHVVHQLADQEDAAAVVNEGPPFF